MLTDFEKEAILSTYEGWELVEFLDVSIKDVLDAALENDWINDDNLHDLLEDLNRT